MLYQWIRCTVRAGHPKNELQLFAVQLAFNAGTSYDFCLVSLTEFAQNCPCDAGFSVSVRAAVCSKGESRNEIGRRGWGAVGR